MQNRHDSAVKTLLLTGRYDTAQRSACICVSKSLHANVGAAGSKTAWTKLVRFKHTEKKGLSAGRVELATRIFVPHRGQLTKHRSRFHDKDFFSFSTMDDESPVSTHLRFFCQRCWCLCLVWLGLLPLLRHLAPFSVWFEVVGLKPYFSYRQ